MKHFIVTILLIVALGSCKKYLDQKPDKKLAVPATIADLQALLDNAVIMNANYPFMGELSADNSYMTTTVWQGRAPVEHNGYIWDSDLFNNGDRNDWSSPYVIVYNANVVLDELMKESFTAGSAEERNNIEGQALFFRSFAFYQLLQIFSKPWSADSAATDMGIALRLSPDFNIRSERASVQQCYQQVLQDTKLAASLLPVPQLFKTRPNKIAAYALLAKIYLGMNNFPSAKLYSDSVLLLQPALMDFKTLNASAARPVALFNPEVIFHSVYITTNSLNIVGRVDTLLLQSYQNADLRRTVNFSTGTDGTTQFKASYDASSRHFNGLATDEIYLTRAECYARLGQYTAAMNDLNTLMSNRWSTGFVPFTASDETTALTYILTERRKELIFRGIRWSDLKRLNKDPRFAVTIKRKLDAQEYYLYPNDLRYELTLPVSVIQQTGMPQNPR